MAVAGGGAGAFGVSGLAAAVGVGPGLRGVGAVLQVVQGGGDLVLVGGLAAPGSDQSFRFA